MSLACVLISDISGSTQLFEKLDNRLAMQQITLMVARMRAIIEETGGYCVKSKGDDTISFFDQPDRAFDAAWRMIGEEWEHGTGVHAGIYFGEILTRENEIYGNAVNTAARLASTAKSGELLIGGQCYEDLSLANKNKFVQIGELQFKGKENATKVYSCTAMESEERTALSATMSGDRASRTESAEIVHLDKSWHLLGGETLTLGRSEECDIVLDKAWVSRSHAALTIKQGQLEFTDHSTSGSVLRREDGSEIFVHRRTNILAGNGTIFLGTASDGETESAITFVTNELNMSFA